MEDFICGAAQSNVDEADHDASSASSDEAASGGGECGGATTREHRSRDDGGAVASLQRHSACKPLKLRRARQGMSPQAWTAILNILSPTRVVLAGALTFEAGLLIALPKYNDARFGLNKCPLVAFCAELPQPNSQVFLLSNHVKWWQAARLCLHTVDAALRGYNIAQHKGHGLAAGLGDLAQKLAQRLCGPTLEKKGHEHRERSGCANNTDRVVNGSRQHSEVHYHSSQPWRSANIVRHLGGEGAELDSDNEAGDSPSTDMRQSVLCKRNLRFFASTLAKCN